MNNEDVQELKKDVKELKFDMAEIKLAVVGNTSLGIKGLPKRVEGLERWRDSVNQKAAFYSGGATVIIIALDKLIEHFWK